MDNKQTNDDKNIATGRRRFIGSMATLGAFFIVPRSVLGGRGYIAPSDKINLGFIGAGRQSSDLMTVFNRNNAVQIIAASDPYQDKLLGFCKHSDQLYSSRNGNDYTSCKPYQDFREILSLKSVDAVVIGSPDHWHAVHVVKAVEAGKDVYCEKPLSLSIDEGRKMANATRKHKRILQTGSMQRSWPEFTQAVKLIRNGYIGELKTVKVSVGGPPKPYDLIGQPIPSGLDWNMWLGPNAYVPYHPDLAPPPGSKMWAQWRAYKGLGGGDLSDWGAHMFDIVQWAMGMDESGPVKVLWPDGKDLKHLTMVYANGVQVSHEDFGRKHAIRFTGTKGQIDLGRKFLETNPASLKTQVIPRNDQLVLESRDHYDNWINAIHSRKDPICNVETGHRSASVCNLALIAYELKRSLTWDPQKENFVNDPEANGMKKRRLNAKWGI